MEYAQLGRTGLRVSVAGLGCGGSSRLGLATGGGMKDAVRVVKQALDLGVNFFDTAEAYGTEEALGEALRGVARERVVISTKSLLRRGGALRDPAAIAESLDGSLRRLGVDHVDVFLLHAVSPADYGVAREHYRPVLERARETGKVAHIGVTETAPFDPRHEMLTRALADDGWEAAMLAFHMMNQNARAHVLPAARARGVGTLIMFAVRAIFSDAAYLARTVTELADSGQVPAALSGKAAPLDFLVHEAGARSVIDAAYRYVRHEPGVDVVLFGTGSAAHVVSNVASLLRPPLPDADCASLANWFGGLEGVGLDLPRGRGR